MGVTCLIGDRFGRIITELTPDVGTLPWRLNKIGKTTLTLAKSDAKLTEDNIRYGNRVLIQFTEDVGLPDWGGVMDTPVVWRANSVGITVYTIEHLLQFRITSKSRNFNDAPVGGIFRAILEEVEQRQPMGLTFGQIWTGGRGHSPSYHFKQVSWIISESILKLENCDTRFVPHIADGHIRFRAELYEKLGEDKSGRYVLKEGRNAAEIDFTEQGIIVNEFAAAGGGTTWDDDRPSAVMGVDDSNQKYGLRQASKVYPGVKLANTCARHAATQLERQAYPRVRIGMRVTNTAPATYNQYDLGDILQCVLPSYSHGGYDKPVRVVSREYTPGTGICRIVAEEEVTPVTEFRGDGTVV